MNMWHILISPREMMYCFSELLLLGFTVRHLSTDKLCDIFFFFFNCCVTFWGCPMWQRPNKGQFDFCSPPCEVFLCDGPLCLRDGVEWIIILIWFICFVILKKIFQDTLFILFVGWTSTLVCEGFQAHYFRVSSNRCFHWMCSRHLVL